MMRARPALLVALLALPLTLAAQTMYKWVDEKGTTHYSETPPPDNPKATKVEVKPTPPSSSRRPEDPASWRDRARELEQERRAREDAEGKGKATAARREARCREARIAQDRLANVQRLYRYDEKGERHYFTDEERAVEMEKVKKAIAESC
jgi:hypothetical protein